MPTQAKGLGRPWPSDGRCSCKLDSLASAAETKEVKGRLLQAQGWVETCPG